MAIRIFSFLTCISLLCWRCQPSEEKQHKEKQVLEGLVQKYRPDGTLASEITYNNKKKNGPAKYYYDDGSLRSELSFQNNLKQGKAKLYYKSGGVYQVTNYVEGKIDGIQQKFRDDGRLMAEIPYRMGQLGIGLVEYTLEGKPKTKYPMLIVETIDHTLKNNTYIVRVKFSERLKKVMYYVGDLADGKYLHKDLVRVAPKGNDMLELSYTVPRGMFMMKKINIIGMGYTRLRSPLVIQKAVNIAVENKGY